LRLLIRGLPSCGGHDISSLCKVADEILATMNQ
jgi:hypothetical protein